MIFKIKKALTAVCAAIKALVHFAAGALREPDGKPSSSKCGSLLLLVAYIVIVIKTHGIPEHTDQFAILILALHGSNQLKDGLTKFAALRAASTPPPDTPQQSS